MYIKVDFFFYVLPCLVNNGVVFYFLDKLTIKPLQNILDHTIQIVPFIFLTSYIVSWTSEYITYPSAAICIINIIWCTLKTKPKSDNVINVKTTYRDLSFHRGLIYIMTCICILARDLPQFRDDVGKSVYFGTKFMDVGVGLFVLHMGVKGYSGKWNAANRKEKKIIFRKVCQICSILAILGWIRHFALKIFGLSYAPLEYGRDMNVFFVLAVVKLFGTILEITTYNIARPIVFGVIIGVLYEIWLATKMYSTTKFLEIDFRLNLNFFYANVEALISMIGYTALFLCGREIQSHFFNKSSNPVKAITCIYMMVVSIVVFIFNKLLIHERLIFEESRRLCNVSYILWMVSLFLFCSSIIRCFMIYYESNFSDKQHYGEKVDKMGFLYFIVGNLLVGAVRLLKDHFDIPVWFSPVVLYFYCSLNFIVTFYIQRILIFWGII